MNRRKLTQREAKALKVGDFVWMTYRKHSDDGCNFRVDEKVEVLAASPEGLRFSTGDFFFEYFDDDNAPAIDDSSGQGEGCLYALGDIS